jgi:hypothetical protein
VGIKPQNNSRVNDDNSYLDCTDWITLNKLVGKDRKENDADPTEGT